MLSDDQESRVSTSAPVSFAVGAVLAATLAAGLVPYRTPGINLVIVGLAIWIPIWLARPVPWKPWAASMVAVSVTLAASATYTDSAWAVGIGILAIPAFAALAMAEQYDWNGMAVALTAPALRLFHVPSFFLSSIGLTRGKSIPSLIPILRGMLIAGVLLIVFGGLFLAADEAFAYYVSELVPDLDVKNLTRIFVFLVVLTGTGAITLSGSRYKSTSERWDEVSIVRRFSLGRAEWITGLVALDLLFAGFVLVQITVLFGGNQHVLETAGLTYAEYARQGFFQLIAVAALTLAVVAAAIRWGKTEQQGALHVMKLLLGSACVLTIVILVSALTRLGLYEEAYGFTRARLLAHGIILWMGAIFVGIVIAGATNSGSFVPRAVVAMTGIVLITFGLVKPDALIARHNIDRFFETAQVDVDYLAGLGADAVPEFLRLPEPMERCLLSQHKSFRVDSFLSYNFSRASAAAILANRSDLTLGADCLDQFRQEGSSFRESGY